MKKHDEGYILAYVFVILTVICLIATSVLTIPLSNLRIQKAAVAEMQAQYEAEGAVEEVLTLVNQQIDMLGRNMTYTDLNTAKAGVLAEIAEVKAAVEHKDTGMEGVTVTLPDWPVTQTNDYTLHISVVRGPVQVNCEAVLTGVIGYSGTYIVKIPKITYSSYVVAEPTEPTEGGNANES